MKEIGLFFGTFNPIHVGHLIIANHMATLGLMQEVWLVVTPQNPFKQKSTLLSDHHRLALVKVAIDDNPALRASDVEFKLPKPSYTVDTLAHLTERYPGVEFALIMGEDNLRTLHKWKNHEIILRRHKIYVYPRVPLPAGQDGDDEPIADGSGKDGVVRVDAPVMNISSSYVRRAIASGQDVRYVLTEPVYKYVREMHFYEG